MRGETVLVDHLDPYSKVGIKQPNLGWKEKHAYYLWWHFTSVDSSPTSFPFGYCLLGKNKWKRCHPINPNFSTKIQSFICWEIKIKADLMIITLEKASKNINSSKNINYYLINLKGIYVRCCPVSRNTYLKSGVKREAWKNLLKFTQQKKKRIKNDWDRERMWHSTNNSKLVP